MKGFKIIMDYFNSKKIDREELESLLDFENLTVEKNCEADILKLLKESLGGDVDCKEEIAIYVRFIKWRSESGDITWDEFISRLRELNLEESDFGIRVQQFGKTYWEIFFNNFSIMEFKDNDVRLTFDNYYYADIETDKALDVLDELGINTEKNNNEIIRQIGEKLASLTTSQDEKEKLIYALNALYGMHYVDKSHIYVFKNLIKNIHMSSADLVPEVGLRDYSITFIDGSTMFLRF